MRLQQALAIHKAAWTSGTYAKRTALKQSYGKLMGSLKNQSKLCVITCGPITAIPGFHKVWGGLFTS